MKITIEGKVEVSAQSFWVNGVRVPVYKLYAVLPDKYFKQFLHEGVREFDITEEQFNKLVKNDNNNLRRSPQQ